LDEARRAAADAREKLERQNQQLSDLEAEVGLLRRRVEQLETDRDKDKKLIAQLQESLNRARAVCLFSTRWRSDKNWRNQSFGGYFFSY